MTGLDAKNDGGDQAANIQLVKDMVNQNIALSKQPFEELLIRCEKVDQEKVMAIAHELGAAYGAPQECVDRIEDYSIYEVPDELFMAVAFSEFAADIFGGVDDLAKMDKRQLSFALLIMKHVEDTSGVCDTKSKRLYVRQNREDGKKERTYRHEILHAMADFDDTRSGFQNDEDVEADSHNNNEAVVEILEAANHYKMSPTELMIGILEDNVDLSESRKDRVLLVLIPYVLTESTEFEMTLVDLAKYYWTGDMDGLFAETESKLDSVKGSISEEKMTLMKRVMEVVG